MARTSLVSLILVLAACNGSNGKDGDPVTGAAGGTPGGTPSGDATPPIAENDLAALDEGDSVGIDVVGNDLVTTNPLALGSVTVVDPPVNGSIVVQPTGIVDYTHDGGETEEDSFTYTIEDSVGLQSNVATVAISIDPVNDPPVANDDVDAVDQGANLQINVAGNDVDVDDGLDLGSITIVSQPTFGSVSPNANGTVDYVHDGTGVPYDSFSYTITDRAGVESNEATVDLTVYTSNLPPIAGDDFLIAPEGQVTVSDLALNDFDVDDGLNLASITIVAQPAHGTVINNGDGTVDYVHDGSEDASDSFQYQIRDNSGAPSNLAVVVVAVVNTNDPPVATDDDAQVDERQTVNIPVLLNDLDVDNALNPGSVAIGAFPAYGTVVVNGNGTIDYTHDGSQVASDSFTYRVNDVAGGTSNLATVDVVVSLVNDPPELVDGFETVVEGQVAIFDLLPYAWDSDDGLDVDSIVVTTPPMYGLISVNLDGTVTYAHDGSEGAYDNFDFTIADLAGNVSNIARVEIDVTPVNDPPVAVDDAVGASEGAATLLTVLANDVDPEGTLDPTTVQLTALPTSGSATVNGDGTVTYTHNGSETLVDSFSYQVSDVDGAVSNVADVTIAVQDVNDPPVAANDAGVVPEGGGLNVAVLTNDSDPDDGLDVTTVTIVAPPTRGSVAVNADGTIDYTHNGSETASDSFTYRVSDYSGAQSNTATVQLTVTPVNDPPTAVADSAIVAEGSVGNVLTVLSNDSDPDDGINVATVTIVAAPSRGTAVANANGTVTYSHNGSENPGDSFTYRVSDNSGANSATVAVNLTITPVNDAPLANNDSGVPVNEGALVNIAVLANDTDADDGLNVASVVIVSPPARGSASPQANGTVNYTHNGSETVNDSFTYRVSDLAGAQSNIATVSLVVAPVNDAPVAVDDSAGPVDNGALINIDVASNDSDADNGLNLNSITIVTAPSNGAVTPYANGTVDYVHNGSATLSDQFSYTIRDASGTVSNVAQVYVSVNPGVANCTGSTVLYFNNATQQFVAPCAGDYTITAYGAQGQGGNGGLGGMATGVATLAAGEILYVNAGGMNGFNGGGADWAAATRNGGGATDVRLGSNALANRIIVAGGGGGGGPTDVGAVNGGAGGGGTCGVNYCGGAGASGYGGAGGDGGASGGTGNNTCHSGGAGGGGLNSGGGGSCNTCYTNTCGQTGASGQGGNGDTWENGICYTSFGGTSGGGGGYYGGGGSSVGNCGSGGGGGGSSWTGALGSPTFAGGVQAGDGYVEISWEGSVEGAHYSQPFNPPNSQPWFCGGGAELAYWEYFGETTFDECEIIANATGTQYYTGANLAYTTGWIGDQDATTAVAVNGGNWQIEDYVPRDSLRSCSLATFDDRSVPTVSPVEQVYFDAATGRTWHYWDVIGQNHDQTLAFAQARGARIINPNVVGLTGLNRITPPTHWCFASGEFNGAGWCNTFDVCNFMVGYWE